MARTPALVLGAALVAAAAPAGAQPLPEPMARRVDEVFSDVDLGSVSKQFTAAAVLLAARQGALSLDDDIRTWVPEVPDYGPTITIRHLVHHTSGLRDYLELGAYAGRRLEDVWPSREILALISRQEGTNFAPGERYMYSNTGYFLLSEIVHRATGKTLREFARDHMFGPLEMRNTRFHDDYREPIPHRAVGYRQDGDRWVMNHAWGFDQVGSGGVYSSIEDLARWDAEFYRETVGGAGFREAMLERGVLNDGTVLDYAFGLDIGEYRGRPTVSHGGALAGFRSEWLRFPDDTTTVLVLCNFPSSAPGRRAREVADILLADRFPAVEASPDPSAGDPAASGSGGPPPSAQGSPADPDAYAGRYYSPELDVVYTIAAGPAGLELRLADGTTLRLRPAGGETFRAGSLTLRFRREEGGVAAFTLGGARARGMRFGRERSGGDG